jgi:hypothetical protein
MNLSDLKNVAAFPENHEDAIHENRVIDLHFKKFQHIVYLLRMFLPQPLLTAVVSNRISYACCVNLSTLQKREDVSKKHVRYQIYPVFIKKSVQS